MTLTAVYTLRQALLAHSVGACYIAIYLGRMRDAGLDALGLAGQMQALLQAQSASVTILAASIRDPDELTALGLTSVGAATLPLAIPQPPAELGGNRSGGGGLRRRRARIAPAVARCNSRAAWPP